MPAGAPAGAALKLAMSVARAPLHRSAMMLMRSATACMGGQGQGQGRLVRKAKGGRGRSGGEEGKGRGVGTDKRVTQGCSCR